MAVQLEGCNAQLEKLPPPITAEPTAFVLALVTNFCAELAQRVRGSPSNTALVQSTRRTYEAFKLNIRSSAPPFVPYKDQSQAPRDISEYLRVDANDRSARGKKFAGKIYYLEDVRAHISRCIAFRTINRVPYTNRFHLALSLANSPAMSHMPQNSPYSKTSRTHGTRLHRDASRRCRTLSKSH